MLTATKHARHKRLVATNSNFTKVMPEKLKIGIYAKPN